MNQMYCFGISSLTDSIINSLGAHPCFFERKKNQTEINLIWVPFSDTKQRICKSVFFFIEVRIYSVFIMWEHKKKRFRLEVPAPSNVSHFFFPLGFPREITKDGFDVSFATNHLGPFLLTNQLLGRIRELLRMCVKSFGQPLVNVNVA